MTYPCGYCPQRFSSKTELALHQEHEHPQMVKSAYSFFEALQRRYPTR